MRHQILGEIAQYARLELEASDTAWASRGSLMAYSSGIEWEVRIPGGLAGAARRSLAGEGLSLAFLEARAAGKGCS